MEGGKFFLDRDPDTFKRMCEYLKTKQIPSLQPNDRYLLMEEIKYWGVENLEEDGHERDDENYIHYKIQRFERSLN
jgi:hypothetical protein